MDLSECKLRQSASKMLLHISTEVGTRVVMIKVALKMIREAMSSSREATKSGKVMAKSGKIWAKAISMWLIYGAT